MGEGEEWLCVIVMSLLQSELSIRKDRELAPGLDAPFRGIRHDVLSADSKSDHRPRELHLLGFRRIEIDPVEARSTSRRTRVIQAVLPKPLAKIGGAVDSALPSLLWSGQRTDAKRG